MSLLAGVKFVKRATGQAENQGKVHEKDVAGKDVGSGVQQDNDPPENYDRKRKRKHRRKDKDVGEMYSVGDSTKSSSKATKKVIVPGKFPLGILSEVYILLQCLSSHHFSVSPRLLRVVCTFHS